MANEPLVAIAWIAGFVALAVAVTGMSRRQGWSAPIALVAVGAAVSFLPGTPDIRIQPELVLDAILPPLLFAAALRMSLIDVRARRDSILLLSVGLVAFTVLVVGAAVWAVVPGAALAVALAFGAVVAPTDAAAVAAVTRKAPLPRMMRTTLEGESLLNDATSLVALTTTITAIVTVVTPLEVAGSFVVAVVAGVLTGLAGGWVLSLVRSRLEAPVLDTSLSFIAPFLVFVPAELLHGSGLLAVVVAGLFLGYRAPFVQSAEARVAESLNWRTIEFLLENAVFLLIGLALAGIWQGVGSAGIGVMQTLWIALVVVAALVVSRLAWGLAVTALYRLGPAPMRRASWRWSQTIPVTLAGSRGVVTLAAVLLLPPQTPDRAFLQFLAFIVVVATLLIALAVPWSVRVLHLQGPDYDQERVELELLLAEAQTAGLAELEDGDDPIDELVAHRLRTNATFLRDALDGAVPGSGLQLSYGALREQSLGAERRAVLSARAEGRYQEPAVRAVLGIIDAEETALKAVGRRAA